MCYITSLGHVHDVHQADRINERQGSKLLLAVYLSTVHDTVRRDRLSGALVVLFPAIHRVGPGGVCIPSGRQSRKIRQGKRRPCLVNLAASLWMGNTFLLLQTLHAIDARANGIG